MRHVQLSQFIGLTLLLGGCAPGGTFSGTIVDGLAGQPRGELRIIAKTTDSTDQTCMAKEATADASGAFKLDGLCAGSTYSLALSDESLLLEGAPTASGDEQAVGVSLKAWRAPAGAGIYVLSNDELKMVRTFSDIKYETKIDDPTMKVAYPYKKPTGTVSTVNPGDHFIISGKANVDRLKWRPLVPAPQKVTFVDGSITDHVWVGMKFVSDTEWEPVEASPDVSKIKVVTAGERIVHYVPADTLEPGRYALYGDEDKRMFIVDMGGSFAPEKKAEGEATAEGG